jgi:hypothetical protein
MRVVKVGLLEEVCCCYYFETTKNLKFMCGGIGKDIFECLAFLFDCLS